MFPGRRSGEDEFIGKGESGFPGEPHGAVPADIGDSAVNFCLSPADFRPLGGAGMPCFQIKWMRRVSGASASSSRPAAEVYRSSRNGGKPPVVSVPFPSNASRTVRPEFSCIEICTGS